MPAAWLVALLAAMGSGCYSDQTAPSIWPPEDFQLIVSGTAFNEFDERIEQRFRIESDGLALYREAAFAVPHTNLDLPVFSSVSAFRMRDPSVRLIGRMLQRAGLFRDCLLYTSPSPRDRTRSRMPSSA